jgi:hypothetical protein
LIVVRLSLAEVPQEDEVWADLGLGEFTES